MPRRLLVLVLLSAAVTPTVPEDSALAFAACSPTNPSQQWADLPTPGSSGQIKDKASGRCLTAANCSAAGQPAVVLAPCAADSGGCSEWRAVAASAGTTMFELVPKSAAGGEKLCRTLNAPVTGGPVAWGAAKCDPAARNNQWKNSGGLLTVEQGPASCQPSCCLAVAPPPPPPAAPCFASAAAGAARIAAVSVGDNSTAAERFAAQELAEHLGNISGVHIPILRPVRRNTIRPSKRLWTLRASHTDGAVVQAQAQGVKHIAVGYYAATQAGLDPALLTKELLVRLRSTSDPIVPLSHPSSF